MARGGGSHRADGGAKPSGTGRGEAELVKLRQRDDRAGVAAVLDVEDDVGVGVGGQVLNLGLAWLRAARQRTFGDHPSYSVVLQARSVMKDKHKNSRTLANIDWQTMGRIF